MSVISRDSIFDWWLQSWTSARSTIASMYSGAKATLRSSIVLQMSASHGVVGTFGDNGKVYHTISGVLKRGEESIKSIENGKGGRARIICSQSCSLFKPSAANKW